jgi:Protein of unknown function (DUF3106)
MPSPFGRFFRAASVALLAVGVFLLSGESTASIPPPEVPAAIGSGGLNGVKAPGGGWRLMSDRGRGRGDDNRSMDRRYREWESLPSDQKEMLRKRMDRYKDLSPQERDLYQRRHQQWQDLPPDERNRIQEDLKRWENLSPQERDAIRRRFGR